MDHYFGQSIGEGILQEKLIQRKTIRKTVKKPGKMNTGFFLMVNGKRLLTRNHQYT